MATNFEWHGWYRAALIELNPELLRQRIREAEVALQRRSAELDRNDPRCQEELLAISDATSGLRVLATAECPVDGSTIQIVSHSGAAS